MKRGCKVQTKYIGIGLFFIETVEAQNAEINDVSFEDYEGSYGFIKVKIWYMLVE